MRKLRLFEIFPELHQLHVRCTSPSICAQPDQAAGAFGTGSAAHGLGREGPLKDCWAEVQGALQRRKPLPALPAVARQGKQRLDSLTARRALEALLQHRPRALRHGQHGRQMTAISNGCSDSFSQSRQVTPWVLDVYGMMLWTKNCEAFQPSILLLAWHVFVVEPLWCECWGQMQASSTSSIKHGNPPTHVASSCRFRAPFSLRSFLRSGLIGLSEIAVRCGLHR